MPEKEAEFPITSGAKEETAVPIVQSIRPISSNDACSPSEGFDNFLC